MIQDSAARRQWVYMQHITGKTCEEIGSEMGVTKGRVQQILEREIRQREREASRSWKTKFPSVPGIYWAWDGVSVTCVEVASVDSRWLRRYTHWNGPIDRPRPPVE